MDINGSGITEIKAKVLPNYRPKTSLALLWRQTEAGTWVGIDRGSAEDIYEANIGFYDTEDVINNFLTEMQDNREADSHVLTLDNFATTEHIFGEDVDHSTSITATIVEWPARTQGSVNGWGVNFKLRATAVSFTGSSSLPTLQYCQTGVIAGENWELQKAFSYEGTGFYTDRLADTGVFQGVFTLTQADAILLRNYIRTQRTGDFALADNFGVDYPFGPRSTGSYPYTTKLIEWEDLGIIGVGWHRFRLKFAEVF